MKQIRFVDFWIDCKDASRIRHSLRQISCDEYLKEPVWRGARYLFAGNFTEDDPRLERLLDLINAEAIESFSRREIVYTTGELFDAPLLEFSLRSAERDIEKPIAEQFDFSSGCPICHSWSKQIGPARLLASGPPKRATAFQTTNNNYYVAEPVRDALAEAHVNGLELRQVVSTKANLLPWWQMIPKYEMPPMAPETRGIVRDNDLPLCSECHRDGHAHEADEPTLITYRRSQLGGNALPDAALTYECFGITGFDVNGYVAHGRMLISPRIYKVFKALAIRQLRFEPVTILED